MLKRLLLLIPLAVAIVGIVPPGQATADVCAYGRVTAITPTSISVFDRETVTYTLDSRTRYTRMITNWRWQSSTYITPAEFYAGALDVGRLVAVHMRHEEPGVARWVQIATDGTVR